MKIIVNNTPVVIPSDVRTIEDFANWKKVPIKGSAIALNGKLVKVDKWSVTTLSPLDTVLVISAAFGG